MLEEIYIENLAVIEKASIEFTDDLNVFTGETGAGKSILINGINAILGQRVSKDIVRTGEKKAYIQGRFSGLTDECMSKLKELGLSAEDGKIFLSREINSDGGSTARINSRSINVSALKEICHLKDILTFLTATQMQGSCFRIISVCFMNFNSFHAR